jgi:hypothetical protein
MTSSDEEEGEGAYDGVARRLEELFDAGASSDGASDERGERQCAACWCRAAVQVL